MIIVRKVVQDYPGRISGVYIRHVGWRKKRDEAIRRMEELIEGTGSAFLFTADTQDMMRHAAEHGWIE